MLTKFKLSLIGITLFITLLIVVTLSSYCRGKRVGIATTKMVNVTKELSHLEGEKLAIRSNVHALDIDALRNRILDLSSRVHEESAKVRK